jgi:hypothetical protein
MLFNNFHFRLAVVTALCLFFKTELFAQNGVLIDPSGTVTKHSSAVFQVSQLQTTSPSNVYGGFLAPQVNIPNLSDATSPINTPAEGLIVYNTNTTTGKGYYYWSGSIWTRLLNGTSAPPTGSGTVDRVAKWTPTGNQLGDSQIWDNITGVGIGVSPTQKLDVDGITLSKGFQTRAGNTSYHQFVRTGGGAAVYINQVDNTNPILRLSAGTAVANAGVVATFENNGNVSIGPNPPTQKLDVDGQIRMRSGAAVGYIPVSDGDGVMTWTSPAAYTGDITEVIAGTGLTGGGATGALTLNAVGDNGLTTTADDIDLGGTLNQATTITQGTNKMTFNLNGTGDFDIQDNGTSAFFVKDDGNVGIGTNTPVAGATPLANATPDVVLQIGDNTGRPEIRLAGDNSLDISSKIIFDNGAAGDGMSIIFNSNDGVYGPDGFLFVDENNTGKVNVKFNRDNGMVGIGTADPTQSLDVNGQIRMRTGASVGYIPVSSSDGTMTWTDPTTVTASDNDWAKVGGGTPALTDEIYHTGNVGIGVTNPAQKLDVQGNIMHSGNMISRGATYNSTWMQFEEHQYGNSLVLGGGGLTVIGAGESPTTANTAIANPSSETLYLTSDGGIEFKTGMNTSWATRVDAMSILADGKIGMGTTAPTRNLVVENNGDAAIWIDGDRDNAGESDNAYLKISQDGHLIEGILGFVGTNDVDPEGNTYTGMINNGLLLGTTTATDLQFGTSANVRMTLESGGDVGIGTTSPDAKLDVEGDFRVTGVNSKVEFNTKEVNNGWTLIYRDDFESSTDGWNMYENNTSSTTSTEYDRESFGVIGLSTNLNNYNKGSDNDNVFKKEYDMSGITWTEAQITFDYLFIDSWDGRERGYAGVQTTLTGNPAILWVENHDNNDDAQNRINYTWPGTGTGAGDQIKTAMMHTRNNMGGNFILLIGSTLGSNTNDESFGIDNVEVWVR